MSILNQQQINSFISNGFIRVDNAFLSKTAQQAREILWKDTGFDPHDRSTWTKPVVRLGMYTQPPFIEAANTPLLHQLYNELAGIGNWLPCMSMGSFPVRFPANEDAGDTGWHVDAGFPGADPGNYFEWRINVHSHGRALLMLFLFSDVEENDAPTRIKVGSHKEVAQLLQPLDNNGLAFMELANRVTKLPPLPEVTATGSAGTVYLCHPFIVHAAQAHCGSNPKFMAQPPLLLRYNYNIYEQKDIYSPVEVAIKTAIEL